MTFQTFFSDFSNSELSWSMRNTREDSPWHRESSVWEHTRMVLDWYDQHLSSKRNDHQRLLTRFALAFHDTGKPSSEIKKWSAERGDYRAYHEHERVSSRLWVNYALEKFSGISAKFTIADISNVAFMIEHHVPFSIKDPAKRRNLKNAIHKRIGEEGHRAWLDMLLADQHGRVSDDQSTKLANVDAWLIEWASV